MTKATTQTEPSKGTPGRTAILLCGRNPEHPWIDWWLPEVPAAVFGYPTATGILTSGELASRVHPEDEVLVGQVADELGRVGEAWCSYRIRHADGRYRRVQEAWLRQDPTSGVRFPAVCALVTGARKLSPQERSALRDRMEGFAIGCRGGRSPAAGDERFAYALSESVDGLWNWSLDSGVVNYSPRWKEILGYGEGELENHISTWSRLVDPADRDRVLAAVDEVVMRKLPKFEVEFRMRHKDGRWVDILSRANLILDASGRASRLVGTHLDISARRKAESEIRSLNESLERHVRERTAELRESEARLALLIETVPAGIVIHGADGRVLMSNPTAQRLLGLAEENAFGRTLDDTGWQFIHEDGTPMDVVDFPVSRVLASRAPVWNQMVGLVRDGSPCTWAYVNALPRYGPGGEVTEVVVGFMDITERVEAQTALRRANDTLEDQVAERTAALRASEARFRTLSEATSEGVMLSQAGRIVDCNEQLAAILGYKPAEIIGRSLFDFVPPDWRERVQKAISAGVEGNFEHEAICKDGSRRFVETHGRSPEGPDGLRLTAIRDLTAAHMAAAEIEALRSALERSRRTAELSEISAAVIHQFGQPFSAITGNIAALRLQLDEGKPSREFLRDVLSSVETDLRRVRDLVSQLRGLIHPAQEGRRLADLNGLVSEVLRVLQQKGEYHLIHVSFHPAAMILPVWVDAVQIRQAVFNLLENAFSSVAACPAGKRRVEVTTAAADGQVELAVTDCGPPAADGSRQISLNAFFKAESDRVDLGLRICRSIAEIHQGSLGGGMRPDGSGNTFIMRLPRCAAEQGAVPSL